MKRIILILCLACTEMLRAQSVSNGGPDPTTLPEVIPPSPTVASLMKFEEVPVDYHTGQPSIAIPIFSKSVAKNLSINLALRYSTSGVKLNENSSWVGTGWSMEVGGAISRTVRGLPDEFDGTTSGRARGQGVLHLDDFWDYDNLSNDERIRFNWKALGTSVNKYDTDLDLYQFSFPGGSGRFVVEKYSGTPKAKLISKDQLVKIELIDWNSQTYEVYGFKITDVNGYQYVFDKIETSFAESRSFSVSQNGEGNLSSDAHLGDYNFNSAWHLTKITSPNGLFLASIDYNSSSETYNVSKTFMTNEITPALPNGMMQNGYNQSVLKPSRSVSVFNMTTQSWKPSVVRFRDGVHLELIPDETFAHPETGGIKLKEIQIYDGLSTNYLKSITFKSNNENGRLWLNEIVETADDVNKHHYINYTEKDNLPGHSEINDMGPVDDWGYFLPTGQEDKKSGLLKSIVFPTGGSQEFIFEPHVIAFVGSEPVSESGSGNTAAETSLIDIAGSYIPASNGLITEFTIADIEFTQVAQLTFNNLQASILGGKGGLLGGGANPNALANMLLELVDEQGNLVSSLSLSQTLNSTISVPQGLLTGKIFSLSQGTHVLSGSIGLAYEVPAIGGNPTEGLKAGGFRISEILFKDDPTSTTHERKFTFTYEEGALDALRGNLSKEDVVRTEKFLFGTEEMSGNSFSSRRVDYVVKIQGTVNAHMTKGGYVGYGLVKVGEPGNGHTEYSFTSSRNYHSPRESFLHPYPPAPDLDYKRGLLKGQKVFDNSGILLQEIIHEYDFPTAEILASSLRVSDLESCGWSAFYDTYSAYVNKVPSQGRVPTCAGGFPCLQIGFQNCDVPPSHISVLEDNLTFGWAKKISTTTKEYFYNKFGDQSQVESTELYTYNAYNYQISSTERIISEGGTDVNYLTQYYYPVGSDPELDDGYEDMYTAVSSLQSQNRLTTLLYTKSYRNNVLQSRMKNLYANFSITQPNASEPYVTELKKVQTAISSYPLESRIEFHNYDAYSNILEVSKANNIRINYLWGYTSSLPIAKIENGDRNIINSIVNQSVLDTTDEATLTQELNKLRTSQLMSGSMVTTYTYDLLKGVSTVMDPNGYSTYYEYDNFFRLTKVKDFEENVLQQFEYHYNNQ